MSDAITYPETVFFFGAGASKKAGIPLTHEFVAEFVKYIKQNGTEEENKCLHETIQILENRIDGKHGPIDIEDLLSSLVAISDRNKDGEFLSAFYKSNAFSLLFDETLFTTLVSDLKNFIRERVTRPQNIEYLKDLFRFEDPIAIFSVNYDTCIEQLCYDLRVRYSDGFALSWIGTDELTRPDVRVRLHKIHGSAIWYESDDKEYIKIPLTFKTEESKKLAKFKLIFGGDMEPLITYPIQKWRYIEPLTELQFMFKSYLTNPKIKTVVIVGYSFRDEYVKRMLWDAAKKNTQLMIILIDPNAQQLYQEQLQFYEVERKNPSSITGKVLLCPYPFENILLKLLEIVWGLRSALSMEEEARRNLRQRGETDWSMCIKQYIEIGFSSKYNQLIETFGWNRLIITSQEEKMKVILAFKGLLDSLSLTDGQEDTWLSRLNTAFSFISTEDLQLNGYPGGLFHLFFSAKFSGLDVCRLADLEKGLLTPLLSAYNEKRGFLGPDWEFRISVLEESIERLRKFISFAQKHQSNLQLTDSGFKIPEKYNFAEQIEPFVKESFQKHLREEIFSGESFTFSLQPDRGTK